MWNKKYNTEFYVYGSKPNDFLQDHLAFISNELEQSNVCLPKALDLGFGEGRNLSLLLDSGYHCTGIDASSVAARKTRQFLGDDFAKVELIVSDILNFSFSPSSYDLVCSIWLHLPYGARKEVYQKISQCLRPGGFLLLEAFRKEQKNYEGGPPTDKIMPSLSELQDEFKDWHIEFAREVDRELSEGSEHRGIFASLQFLVRKPYESIE